METSCSYRAETKGLEPGSSRASANRTFPQHKLFRERLLEKAESIVSQARFAALAPQRPRPEISLKLRKRPVESFGEAHHFTRLPDTRNRLLQDVDDCGWP
jgi:hypothetical protein